jgi:transposase-like protein
MRKPRRITQRSLRRGWHWNRLEGENAVAEIAAHHEVHATQVTAWKTELLENVAGVFGGIFWLRPERSAFGNYRRRSAS